MKASKRASQLHSAGFTIVELLIVIVVIAILAAITIVSYNGIQARALDSSRDSAANTIRKALDMYATDNSGSYPNACGSAGGCNSTNLSTALVPTYLQAIPRDPKAGTTIDYVVSTNNVGYGLYVRYDSKPACKYLVGAGTSTGWWGASVPAC